MGFLFTAMSLEVLGSSLYGYAAFDSDSVIYMKLEWMGKSWLYFVNLDDLNWNLVGGLKGENPSLFMLQRLYVCVYYLYLQDSILGM